MPNPYLPSWEYIPDGEPRVFGDRVYIYGSHDRPNEENFCDYRLKVWSASVSDLSRWTCHGTCFQTRANRDHAADTDWTSAELYAPDVVEKDGRYYLYAYIVGSRGCVAVSDHPEGPFELLGQYQIPDEGIDDLDQGLMIDPGVLVDDDGRVYIYCGYLHSYMAEINPDNMREILPGSYIRDIIPEGDGENDFFEACSPRKIGDTYYLIYSPKKGSRLAYMTAKKPTGPFTFRGYIVDNEEDYPGGNDHGSVCKIGDQWYIFYHRMTNDTCMSRRGAVERIELLPDGSFTHVPMTSMGFEPSLNPYEVTNADLACVLTGGCFITEKNLFERPIVNIKHDAVIGFRTYDFGEDFGHNSAILCLDTEGTGQSGLVHIYLDSLETEEVGCCKIEENGGILRANIGPVAGRHDLYLKFDCNRTSWIRGNFLTHDLMHLKRLVFVK